MDHTDVRALLDDAAVEPGGLERLTAGDTAEAAAVAGHLAGCPECSREHVRVARLASILGGEIQRIGEEPRFETPADLRARTLDYVRAVGRSRAAAEAELPAPAVSMTVRASEPPASAESSAPGVERREPTPIAAARSHRTAGGFRPILALAAALVLAVVGAAAVVRTFDSGQLADQSAQLASRSAQVEALTELTNWSFRVTAQADARSVRLASSAGSGQGVVLYSPTSGDVVVLMTGFATPTSGTEYRCWVEVNGRRQPIGRMSFEGGIAYWVGSSWSLTGVGPGATFGVTLVDQSSGQPIGGPVLTGTLGA